MRRKNLWLRLSSCTMAALIATTSIVPVSAADVEFQDEVSAETPDTEAEEVSEAPEAEVQEQEDITLTTEENTDQAAEELQDAEDAAELTAEDGFSDGDAVVQEAAADAVSDTVQTGFGSANTSLEKGAYAVTVTLMNASDPTKESMAASCIAGKGTLVVAEDGSAKLTVPIQAANVRGQVAYAKDWKVYKNSEKTESTDAEYTVDEDGNVNSITFDIPDKTQDGVYVSMYIELMNAIQDAFMNVDYANAEKEQVGVDTTALEAAIAQADALDEMAYTKASWDGNKEAIDTANAAAKEALEKKESQEAVDAAATALTDALGKLVAAGDSTALKEILDNAKKAKETDYTVKSVRQYWSDFQNAIVQYETSVENRENQSTMNQGVSTLKNYMNNRLVKAYDKTRLTQEMQEMQELKEEDYTADSWKAADVTNLLSKAQYVIDSRGNKEDVNGMINDLEDAMDKLVPVSTEVTVGRGSFAKKLTAGTYSLPIELLNAGHIDSTEQYTTIDYMKHTSMAAGCFPGTATLVIHQDGTATLTTAVGAVSSDKLGTTQSGAADDWSIYENTQDFLNGDANSSKGARYAAHVDKKSMLAGKRKPSQISFTVPDLKQNVIAARMHIEVMGVYQDGCIGLDWKNVKKVSDDTSATSTVEKVYEVKADTLTQLKNMKAGSTVKLDEDVTLTEDLTVKGGTLDLNGHTLNQADNLIRVKGDVTITDSSAEKTGKITAEQYMNNTYTQTSISVEKGSLTADGITIDGQIGNKVYYDGSNCLTGLPRVSVKLTNCTLLNSQNNYSVSFAQMKNGFELVMDKCSSERGVYLENSNVDDTAVITNCTLGSYGQYTYNGGSVVFTNNTVAGNVTLSLDKLTVRDDTISGGLTLSGRGDVTLENIQITNKGRRSGALSVSGSGTVVVKSGVYENSNSKGYAIKTEGYPITIEGGYFKSAGTLINGEAYQLPEGKVLSEVTEGEYAGYYTVTDGKVEEVEDPVATIYNADGSVAKKISEEKAALATTFADNGQTVKLNKDMTAEAETYFKDITVDLNGHTMTLESGFIAEYGTCHVTDSSAEKTGKIVSSTYMFTSQDQFDTGLILDGVSCEVPTLQLLSIGKLYIINGTKINGTNSVLQTAGTGSTYIQDSTWKFAETDSDGNVIDGEALLKDVVRTAQYAITKNADGSFTMTATDLGKAMRAFEKLDASAYTKTSYAAAKAIYDEIDGTVDEEYTAEDIAKKTKELNDAMNKLQAPATAKSVSALKSAVTAGKKLKSTDYTASTFKAFTTALTSAEKVLNNADHSEAQVTSATKSLAAAKAKLVKKNTQTITVTVKNTKGTVTKKYGDKAFYIGAKAKGGLTYKSSNTKVATVDSKGKVTIKGTGAVRITMTAKATSTYKAATRDLVIKVAKKTPSITTKISSKAISYNTLKKKSQVFTLGTSVASKGTLTYKKLSGTSAITVNSKTGKFTVKKGLKKGTYRVKVQIKSAAKGNYNAASRTMTVTVKVK